MAQGATISVDVPSSSVGNLAAIHQQLQKINKAMLETNILGASLIGTFQNNTTATAAASAQMSQLNAIMGQYQGFAAGASASTQAMSTSLASMNAWLHKTSIGLYVMGGAFTQVARVGMGASLMMNTFGDRINENNRYVQALTGSVTGLRVAMSKLWSLIKIMATGNLGKLLGVKGLLGGAGAAAIGTFASAVGVATVLLGGLAVGAAVLLPLLGHLGGAWADVQWHMQKVINASDLAQSQMGKLSTAIFHVQRQLGVFTTTEVADMAEKLAYAGVELESGFVGAAKSVGMLAYIAEKDIGEITRDLSRLREQMGVTFMDVADTILGTFAQASISYEDTIETFQQAGLILKENLGVTRYEVGAMAISLAQFGYTGGRAATAIRALAAEASQLKAGLERTSVVDMLGIEDAYQQFQKGTMSIVEFVQTAGDAGATFGHFTSMFRKRAAVIANAIAQTQGDWDEWVESVKEGSGEALKQFDKLKNGLKGLQKQVKVAKNEMAMRGARLLAPIATAWNHVKLFFFRWVGKMSRGLRFLTQAAGLYFTAMRKDIELEFLLLLNLITKHAVGWLNNQFFPKVADPIMGFINQASQFFGQGKVWKAKLRVNMPTIFEDRISVLREDLDELYEKAQSIATGLKEDIDVAKTQQELREQMDSRFKKSLIQSTEALNDLKVALSGPGLTRLLNKAAEGFQDINAADIDQTLIDFGNKLQQYTGLLTDKELSEFQSVLTQFTAEMLGPIEGFIQLSQAQDYLQATISKVEESMSELYGTNRYIARRHGAIRMDTGEVIGQVTGGQPGGGSQQLPPDVRKSYDFLKSFSQLWKERLPKLLEKGEPTSEIIKTLMKRAMAQQGIDVSQFSDTMTPELNVGESKLGYGILGQPVNKIKTDVGSIDKKLGKILDERKKQSTSDGDGELSVSELSNQKAGDKLSVSRSADNVEVNFNVNVEGHPNPDEATANGLRRTIKRLANEGLIEDILNDKSNTEKKNTD